MSKDFRRLFYLKAVNGSKITKKSAEIGEINRCNFPKTISSVFYLCLKHSGIIVIIIIYLFIYLFQFVFTKIVHKIISYNMTN